jgi:hypothetical protein
VFRRSAAGARLPIVIKYRLPLKLTPLMISDVFSFPEAFPAG